MTLFSKYDLPVRYIPATATIASGWGTFLKNFNAFSLII